MVKQAPFRPTDIGGCQLWLDGADTTTITGRSPVTAWRDKSANNLTLTATGAPTVTTVNGLNSLSFNGSSSFLLNPFTQTSNVSYISWFAVANITNAASATYGCIVGTGYASDNYTQNMMYIQPAGSLMIFYRITRGGTTKSTTIPLITGNVLLGTATNFTTGTYQLFQNGIAGTLQTDGPTGVDTQAVILRVGHDGFEGDTYVQGTISELLLYTTALTTAQRQQIEAYLAQKWGLQPNLPQGHPGTRGVIYPIQRLPNAIYWRYQTPFDPTSINNCIIWLDAKDPLANGSVLADATTIPIWYNKVSGSSNATTFSGKSPPVLSNASFNGSPSVYFNGTTQMLYIGSNVQTTQNATFCMVTRPISPNSITTPFNITFTTQIDQRKDINGNPLRTFSANKFEIRDPAGNYQASSTYTPPELQIQVWRDKLNLGQGYVNGTLNYTASGTYNQQAADTYGINIGGHYNYNVSETFYLAEFLVYNEYLTDSQYQQVEGYLAWKWGMQAELPANHPYKNSAPFGSTNPAGISRPANVLPIPSIACTPIRTYFLVTGGLVFHVDAGNPASYPGSGSTWFDLTTSGLNVTLYSSPTYSSANGGYIAFTPSSSQYGGTTLSYNTALTRWTTEAWHYFTNVTVGNLSAIICKTFAGDVNFALGSPVGGASGKNLAAAYYAGTWYYTSSSYTLPSVGWYHLVGTYDGTNLRLYVNNVLTQTQASSQTPGLGGGLIHLMRRWDTGDYWGGYLAIARVYNRALSADEINTNYQLSKARFGLS
jgi:hypothetical protein